ILRQARERKFLEELLHLRRLLPRAGRLTSSQRLESSLDTDDSRKDVLDHVPIRGQFLRYGGGGFDLSHQVGAAKDYADQDSDCEETTYNTLSSHGVSSFLESAPPHLGAQRERG